MSLMHGRYHGFAIYYAKLTILTLTKHTNKLFFGKHWSSQAITLKLTTIQNNKGLSQVPFQLKYSLNYVLQT